MDAYMYFRVANSTQIGSTWWTPGMREEMPQVDKFPVSKYSSEVEQQVAEAYTAYCVYQCLKAVQVPCILRLQSPATQSYISFIQENYLG